MNNAKRVTALEQSVRVGGVTSWVRIMVPLGQDTATARARYEAEHGTIGPDVGIIYRQLVAPSGQQS